MEHKYTTVTAISRYIKFKLEADDNLKTVYIRGEISNFKAHTNGHLYFSLKDEFSKINAIMFNSMTKKLAFKPIEGTKVLVKGHITMYEGSGTCQVIVDNMQEDGIGNLYLAFEKLKQKLEMEGLFKAEHKRKIPSMPNKIGVITAPTGAAIRDIISTIKRRYPICQILLFPSLVQGEQAALDIVKNIEKANTYDLDVLIVGRGGGAIEDLWPFNEEIVARAIYNSNIPIISAVGHEVDFTIADFVADLRAPTPTGAAEMAVLSINDLINNLNQIKIRLNESIYKNLNYKKVLLDAVKNSFVIKRPMMMYESKKQFIDLIIQKLNKTIYDNLNNSKIKLEKYRHHYLLLNPTILYKEKILTLNSLIDKLEIMNPLNTLKRGYTLALQNNQIVKNIHDLKENDRLDVKFKNGVVTTIITKIKEEE